MKILKLTSENIKVLKAIEIEPNGNVITLVGKNGSGKSSILDSIFMALTGKKCQRPIRDGEERAEVTVDLGEFIVRKIWTKKGDRLEVSNAEGAVFKSPQLLLNKIIGDLSFDPLSFNLLTDKVQGQILLKLAGIDLKSISERRAEVYLKRTNKNRELKQAQSAKDAHIANMEVHDEDLPKNEISFTREFNKVEKLEAKREVFSEGQDNYESLCKDVLDITNRIELQKQELKRAQILKKQFQLPDEVTAGQVKEAKKKLKTIEKTNNLVREANDLRELTKNVSHLVNDTAGLTSDIEVIDDEKLKLLTNAKFPVKGLSVDDEIVLYEGIPFNQISTGHKTRISTAIAMKLNPKLKVIFIRDGSLLDTDNMAEIEKMAKKNDYQIWVEAINSNNDVCVRIENGELT